MVIAFVDDNAKEQQYHLKLLTDVFKIMNIPVERIDLFSNGKDFLTNWKSAHYDLIILDILMDEMSGIAVANEVRRYDEDVRIVFCSHSNEYAYESYRLNASYYIQKPATVDNINRMITRLQIKDYESLRFIELPNKRHLILRNIIYAECTNHTISVYLKSGEVLTFWSRLHKFMEQLAPYKYFLQCNKGSIINMHEVVSYSKECFLMTGDTPISISRRRQKEVQKKYHQFLVHSCHNNIT